MKIQRGGALCCFLVLMFATTSHAQISYETGSITGTVLGSDDSPVGGTRVIARSETGYFETMTDAAGGYTIQLVPVGAWRVEAYYQHSWRIDHADVTVTAGQPSTASFTFLRGTVRAQVTQDGVPVAGALLQLVEQPPSSCAAAGCPEWDPINMPGFCGCESDGRFVHCDPNMGCRYMDAGRFEASTDGSGNVVMTVPAIAYNFTVHSSMTATPGQWGSVAFDGDPTTVADLDDKDLGLYPYATGTLNGTVRQGGVPVPFARIRAQNVGGGIEVSADANGAYTLRLPDMTYSVQAFKDWMVQIDTTKSVTVVAAESQQLDFNDPAGTVRGTVTRDGGAAVGAEVRLTELPPASCAAAGCPEEPSMPGFCGCMTAENRFVHCDPSMGCRLMDPRRISTQSDASGAWTVIAPPDDYLVEVFAAPEPNQWGQIRVDFDPVSIADGSNLDLGDSPYMTGEVSGSFDSCGQPLSGLRVRAQQPTGSVETTVFGAGYTLRLPIGTYDVRAEWSMNVLAGQDTITIVSGTPQTFSGSLDLGELRGQVLRDGGQASRFSRVELEERAPASCAAAGCPEWDPINMPGFCGCTTAENRFVHCDPNMGCRLMDAHRFDTTTGDDGRFTVQVPADDYHVRVYSESVPGQHGSALVGSLVENVLACQLIEIGASGATVGDDDDGEPIALSAYVSITFDSITSGGEISYTATSTPQGPAPPNGIQFVGLFYDFITNVVFDGTAEVCLPYDIDTIGDPLAALIYHNDPESGWTDITTRVDTVNQLVCGNTPGFSWFAVAKGAAVPPVANAGAPIVAVVDDSCRAEIEFDGSGTVAGPDATYTWTNGSLFLCEGVQCTALLGAGTQLVTLTVTDGADTSSSTVQVDAVDRTAPHLSVAASPASLWPPNGKMVPITASFTVTDNCDSSPVVSLVGVTGPSGDITVGASQDVSVRAARTGAERDGRTYTLTYSATDRSNNASTATGTVYVPFSQAP